MSDALGVVSAALSQPHRVASLDLAMDGDALTALDRIGRIVSIARDQALFLEGDRAKYCFKVVAGTVRSCRRLFDGSRYVANFNRPGDFIGLNADEVHRLSAEAVTDATLMRYPRAGVEQMAAAQPRLRRLLLELVCRNLAAAQQQTLLLGQKSPVERVASFLVMMSARSNDPEHLSLPMTSADIGDYLGLTVETVNRIIGQLRAQQIIQVSGPAEVLVKDIITLENLAEAA
jgi:CRP-like cAMP-binding protein